MAVPWLRTCLGGAVEDRKGPGAWRSRLGGSPSLLPFESSPGRADSHTGIAWSGMCLSRAHRAALFPETRVQPAVCLAGEPSFQCLSRGTCTGVTVRSVSSRSLQASASQITKQRRRRTRDLLLCFPGLQALCQRVRVCLWSGRPSCAGRVGCGSESRRVPCFLPPSFCQAWPPCSPSRV